MAASAWKAGEVEKGPWVAARDWPGLVAFSDPVVALCGVLLFGVSEVSS